MRYLCADLETTGLDTENDQIIELGFCVWDTDAGAPIEIYNGLIRGREIPKKIQDLTGIRPEWNEAVGVALASALTRLVYVAKQLEPDAYAFHNGISFDWPFLQNEAKRSWFELPDLPVVDTRYDPPYPLIYPSYSLDYLAREHKIENSLAHRAVFDALAVGAILQQYAPDMVLEAAGSELVTVQLMVEYQQRQAAKDNGYWWRKSDKAWLKKIRRCYLEAEAAAVGFPLQIWEPDNAQENQSRTPA